MQAEEITLTWSKLQLMMTMMREYGKVSDPIALFRWRNIGLERIIGSTVNFGWRFKVIDKCKLVNAVIKYGLEL